MLFILLSGLTGLAYPLAMTGIANVLMPHQAQGSLIRQDGHIVGSALIGQNFTRPGYFHGRLSATASAPYNAAASAGSNLGPTSHALADRAAQDVRAIRAENPEAIAAGMPVPADLVSASASGLDPEISPAAAFFQVPRIARVRGLTQDRVRQVVKAQIREPLLGWLGEPRVNVLALNMALDAAAPAPVR